jgi:hypothetical protein
MTYIYNENFENWKTLANFNLPVFVPGAFKNYQEFQSAENKARAKCPFCESVLSYCSMRSHVYRCHSVPEKNQKPDRIDKLPIQLKLAHRKEYNDKYREEHKETIRQKFKETYEANKDEINKKVDCVCGKQTVLKHKARHEQSKHHQKYMKQ